MRVTLLSPLLNTLSCFETERMTATVLTTVAVIFVQDQLQRH